MAGQQPKTETQKCDESFSAFNMPRAEEMPKDHKAIVAAITCVLRLPTPVLFEYLALMGEKKARMTYLWSKQRVADVTHNYGTPLSLLSNYDVVNVPEKHPLHEFYHGILNTIYAWSDEHAITVEQYEFSTKKSAASLPETICKGGKVYLTSHTLISRSVLNAKCLLKKAQPPESQ